MIEALLIAARDRLMSQLKLDRYQVGIKPKGRPPAAMGDFYISLDEAGIQSSEKASLKELYSINVWFTLRSGVFPNDGNDEPYLLQSKLLTKWERGIIAAIHGRQEVRAAADDLLEKFDVLGSGGFTMPLYYTGRSATDLNGDWILGEKPGKNSPCMVRMLPFSGGLRLQNLDTIA